MIIGITGKKQSGKSTTAEMIREQLGDENVIVLGFADLLKEAVCELFSIDLDTLEVLKVDNVPCLKFFGREYTMREFLQHFGLMMRSVFGKNFWVDELFTALKPETTKTIVIPDVRLDNEAEAIIDRGGTIWQILGGEIGDDHITEAGIKPKYVDYVIRNERKDPTFLRDQVRYGLDPERTLVALEKIIFLGDQVN